MSEIAYLSSLISSVTELISHTATATEIWTSQATLMPVAAFTVELKGTEILLLTNFRC